MPITVFISHSVGEAENPIVNHLAASLSGAGIPNYLAMHDRQPGTRLTEKVKTHITASQVLVALLTRKGNQSSWVHDEIGFALGKGRRVVALLEKGLKVDGMHNGAEYFEFDPADPASDIAVLSERLARQGAEEEAESARGKLGAAQAQADAVMLFAVVVVIIALVAIAVVAGRK